MIETDFTYQYESGSYFLEEKGEKKFSFSTNTEIEEDQNIPCFFYGNLKNAYIVSRCLSVLANTVSSHFSLTPGQIAKLKDPIVSVGAGELHFEAFSSCNSVYARVNILEDGIDGEFLHPGTTNIDFNNDTARAFNNVLQKEKLMIGIGSKNVQIITDKSKTIEKKVTLPNRWIKGLGNVQVYLSEMELAFKLTKFEALQLFKTLPKTTTKSEYYLTKIGATYSFAPIEKLHSIKIGGIHRLNLFQKLIPSLDSVLIYKHVAQESFALVLCFKDVQMTYLFSNNVYRGFSGEGKLLKDLSDAVSLNMILGINHLYKTNEVVNPTLLSIEQDLNINLMNSVQANLSGIGLLGYNLINNNYFYRKLPFKLERLLSFNPRLKNARKIIENEEIIILEKTPNNIKAKVKGSGDVYHTVIKKEESYQCTCNWYTNNKNSRGQCKHILALIITNQ